MKEITVQEATEEELLEALLAKRHKPDFILVFGTMGYDIDRRRGMVPFVEVFRKVEKIDDLEMLVAINLRGRFNTHRHYKGFYFKTDQFEKLEKLLEEDNEAFARWIDSTDSVKFMQV